MVKMKPISSIKEQSQERAAILAAIDRIVEGYPNLTVAQHMKAILRTKGKGEDPFSWSNKTIVHKIEKY